MEVRVGSGVMGLQLHAEQSMRSSRILPNPEFSYNEFMSKEHQT